VALEQPHPAPWPPQGDSRRPPRPRMRVEYAEKAPLNQQSDAGTRRRPPFSPPPAFQRPPRLRARAGGPRRRSCSKGTPSWPPRQHSTRRTHAHCTRRAPSPPAPIDRRNYSTRRLSLPKRPYRVVSGVARPPGATPPVTPSRGGRVLSRRPGSTVHRPPQGVRLW